MFKLLGNAHRQPIETLQLATLLYLGMPLLLFFISWLKWYYALLMVVFLFIPVLRFNFSLSISGLKQFSVYVFLFGLFLLLLGFGEIFPQSGDWGKHNAIFSHLYHSWNQPVFINYKGENHILCYGLGFYMIPAWIAGLFKSLFLMRWLILINSAIGLTLIGLWSHKVFKIPVWVLMLVLLTSSLAWLFDIEYFQSLYSSKQRVICAISANQFLARIDQTPPQGISTFMVFMMVFYGLQKTAPNYFLCVLVSIFGFFWNPFLIFALLPMVVFLKLKVLKSELKSTNVSSIIGVMVLILFLMGYYVLHLSVGKVSLWLPGIRQLIFPIFIRYLLSYGLLIGLIYYLNLKMNILTVNDTKLMAGFLLVTLLFKQVGYGFYDDFSSKTTFLIAFILNAFLFKLFISNFNLINKWARYSIVSFIGLSSVMSIVLIAMKILTCKSYQKSDAIGFNDHSYQLSTNGHINLNTVLNEVSTQTNYPFIIQYLGHPNALANEVFKK